MASRPHATTVNIIIGAIAVIESAVHAVQVVAGVIACRYGAGLGVGLKAAGVGSRLEIIAILPRDAVAASQKWQCESESQKEDAHALA
jgi:hypothetical protein